MIDAALPPPAAHALAELQAALAGRGIDWRSHQGEAEAAGAAVAVLVGVVGASAAVARALARAGTELPAGPETLAYASIAEGTRSTVVVAGGDGRGLMYALYEAARRIATAGDVSDLAALFPAEVEAPETELRSIAFFPQNAALEREWFYSREYWESYFATLARARFNNYSLIFGHQTAYFSPPYPFFVEVPEHPEVTVPGLDAADRDRNLATLKMIGRLCVEHGLDFTLGVWQQHAHEYGRSRLDGLDDQNLVSFCAAGMRRLVAAVPEISCVQLRLNAESGILLEQGTDFWRALFEAIKASGRPVRLSLRAKAIVDDTIAAALETGLPVEVCTKHWMEHLGLPYLATDLQLADRLVRRHGYNDLLPRDRPYDFVYQLWNLGTNKLFLWADPDWVRHFARSCRLGDARGFEVCMPLSNKGFRDVGGDWPIFADASYAWYRWEYERYWPWYLLFGRLGYRSDTPVEVWQRELVARFGAAAAPHVDEALRQGSRFLPLITAAQAPSASVFGYWPEMDTGGLLDFYLEVEPSDRAHFYGPSDYVRDRLAGRLEARATPEEVSRRLDELADRTAEALERADALVGDDGAREYRGVRLDLTAQATLARYHAAKRRAAEGLALFYAAGDVDALRRAQQLGERARCAWEELVALTRGVYQENLILGPVHDHSGSWQDRQPYVEHDVARLREVDDLFRRYGLFDRGFDFGAPPAARTGYWLQPIVSEYPVERRFTGVFSDTLYTPERGYGWHSTRNVEASEAPATTLLVLRGSQLRPQGLPTGMLFADHVRRTRDASYDNSVFLVDLPNGLYDLRFVMVDRSAEPRSHGPMWITVQGRHTIEPFTVEPGQHVEKALRVPVRHGRLEVEMNADPASDWILNALIVTRVAPHIGHVPPEAVPAGGRWRLAATVTGPEPVGAVRLRHRWGPDAEWRDRPLAEESPACYVVDVDVPADATRLEYVVEAEDRAGSVVVWPLDGAQSVAVSNGEPAPRIAHQPIARAAAGRPLRIEAAVAAGAPLRAVTLYYRNLNQKEPLVPLPMCREGDRYVGTIPGEDVLARWDLLYFVGAVDEQGRGAAFPSIDEPPPYVVVTVDP